MDGKINRQKDEQTDGKIKDRRMNKEMDGKINRRMNKWTEG